MKVCPLTDFKSLGLSEQLLQAVAAENHVTPTPIQAQAIPHVLAGRDLVGLAQTGTGKTAAFALPMMQRLAESGKKPQRRGCRALILSPTRELAAQIATRSRAYGKFYKFSVATAFGGVSIGPQRNALAQGVDLLVATPGRLLDLIGEGFVTLGNVEVLVLDEADQMLDLGFFPAIRKVVALVPKERQTLFFSATMPPSIAELSKGMLRDPVQVSVTPAATTAERVAQQVIFADQASKRNVLADLLADETIGRTLVFTRTKHGADRVVRQLEDAGIEAAAIHGNKSQSQRERALGAFRQGTCKVLVATDIAARGIDVPGVTHVINYELPNVPEAYVHRIGRTARAGAEGLAISLCAGDEKAYLRDIERLIRQKIDVLDHPKAVIGGPRDTTEQRPDRRHGRPQGHGHGRPQGAQAQNQGGRPQGHGQGRPQGQQARPQGQGRPGGGQRQGGRPSGQRHSGTR